MHFDRLYIDLEERNVDKIPSWSRGPPFVAIAGNDSRFQAKTQRIACPDAVPTAAKLLTYMIFYIICDSIRR